MSPKSVTVPHAVVSPENVLAVLSQAEVNKLCNARQGPVFDIFRRCALAALTSGVETDNARELLDTYADFEVGFEQVDRGLRMHLHNAPGHAFVDGVMIRGVQQQLFAVLRDIVFIAGELSQRDRFDLSSPAGITDGVFHILRHAGLLRPGTQRGVVVCWGGHSIGRAEYDYCKEVGYQLGLRGLEERFLDELSGGQRQRAFVAMVLSQDTDYLLLDEPLNSLDMKHATEMMALLRRTADAFGKTVVVVLHDINFASCYADRVVALREGRLAFDGTPQELMRRDVLAAIYDMDIEIHTIAGHLFGAYHLSGKNGSGA